jgi:hypothetical protein
MNSRVFAALALHIALHAPVHAQDFIGYLDGLQENPPVATPGSGTGTASYNAGSQMLSVQVDFSGLIGTTTNAHIHCCATALDQNTGIALHFVPHGFPLGVTSGNFSHTFDLSLASTYDAGYLAGSGGTAAMARDRLLDAMQVGVANDPLPGDSSIAYFNIHTSFRSGGEIRGNLAPIPEPSAMLLLTCGVTSLAFARRWR